MLDKIDYEVDTGSDYPDTHYDNLNDIDQINLVLSKFNLEAVEKGVKITVVSMDSTETAVFISPSKTKKHPLSLLDRAVKKHGYEVAIIEYGCGYYGWNLVKLGEMPPRVPDEPIKTGSYSVYLSFMDEKKASIRIKVIKIIRDARNMNLNEARTFLDERVSGNRGLIKDGLTEAEADTLCRELINLGAWSYTEQAEFYILEK